MPSVWAAEMPTGCEAGDVMEPLDAARVVAQSASRAGDLIEDAGARFMAVYWEQESDPQKQGLILMGWCVAIEAFAKKAVGILQFALDAQELGEAGMTEVFRARYGSDIISPGGERIRKKIAEYVALERLGEGT